jgi:hypothetical protein
MPEATSARFGPRVVFTKGYQPTWSPRHPLSENLHRAGQERLGRDHASDPLLPIPKAGGVSTRLWHQTGAPNWRTKLAHQTDGHHAYPHGATYGFTCVRPVASQPWVAPTAFWLRFCWTPRGVTQGAALPVCSTLFRVNSFHFTGNAPLSWRTGPSNGDWAGGWIRHGEQHRIPCVWVMRPRRTE